ncbi:MAG: hypothetical protein ACRDH2_14040 [Anaerolineales bacterium]
MNAQRAFWREWGPVMACALLTGAGLYLLIIADIPLAAFVLFTLALGCPLAVALVWRLQRKKS